MRATGPPVHLRIQSVSSERAVGTKIDLLNTKELRNAIHYGRK